MPFLVFDSSAPGGARIEALDDCILKLPSDFGQNKTHKPVQLAG
jgi:hypothetical protein